MKTVKMYSISELKRSTVQIKLKMTNESKGPRTKMLLVYAGATDRSDQPKIKYKDRSKRLSRVSFLTFSLDSIMSLSR